MPADAAHVFIAEHETASRELYSGFLGPVNTRTGTHIHVNLRCLRLFDAAATLFAGAGITLDSRARSEWDETVMKMSAVRNVVEAAMR